MTVVTYHDLDVAAGRALESSIRSESLLKDDFMHGSIAQRTIPRLGVWRSDIEISLQKLLDLLDSRLLTSSTPVH